MIADERENQDFPYVLRRWAIFKDAFCKTLKKVVDTEVWQRILRPVPAGSVGQIPQAPMPRWRNW
ncbi:MAG TPA: hypothetical protein DD465_11480 [Thalassospira sp.]|nr:hypothetical protein [Thalassospira sp.]